MFDSICITRQQLRGNPLDLGFLAEALVFYRRVHIVADQEMFTFLLRKCGPDTFLASLKNGILTVSYLENRLAVGTMNKGTEREHHGLAFVEAHKHRFQEFAPKLLRDVIGKSGKSRRLAQQFANCVKTVHYRQPEAEAAKDDLVDDPFARKAALGIMGCLAPDYQVPEPFTFRIFSEADSLRVETNLDFDAANESYHRFFPDSSLDSALLIAQIYEGGATLRLAAEDSDELALSPECSVVATAKFATILQKRGMSDTEIGLFQEWVFSEGRAIREAVNAGHRNFEDVLQLVERGKEFKEWVADQPDDSNLRKEYCIAVTKVGWADKLQVRATRWALLVGASEAIAAMTTPIVGGTSGIAMSAANSFLVDKLIKGWRPNQFVAGPLRTFVDKSVNHAP